MKCRKILVLGLAMLLFGGVLGTAFAETQRYKVDIYVKWAKDRSDGVITKCIMAVSPGAAEAAAMRWCEAMIGKVVTGSGGKILGTIMSCGAALPEDLCIDTARQNGLLTIRDTFSYDPLKPAFLSEFEGFSCKKRAKKIETWVSVPEFFNPEPKIFALKPQKSGIELKIEPDCGTALLCGV